MWFLLSWISNQHKQQTFCRHMISKNIPAKFDFKCNLDISKKKFQQDHMYQSVLSDVVAILNFRSIQKMKVFDGPSNDNSCIDQVESKVQYFMKTISFIIIYKGLILYYKVSILGFRSKTNYSRNILARFDFKWVSGFRVE